MATITTHTWKNAHGPKSDGMDKCLAQDKDANGLH